MVKSEREKILPIKVGENRLTLTWVGHEKISENKQNFRYFPSRFSAFHTLEASNLITFRTHDNYSPFGAAFPTFYNKNLDERHKKNLHYLVFNAALNRETVKDALCTAPEAQKEIFCCTFISNRNGAAFEDFVLEI